RLPPCAFFSWALICENPKAPARRTVARRTERCAVRVAEREEVDEEVMRYINRLSDYLYVLGRYICLGVGAEETVWVP
ncbi:MAG: ATP:cob(I)alamin adenosyltransferase, partial [Rikenellaceae bacterium]|nr:ATP:cob(I)alamin adenosyltransferase [Rikenellaceae bacterium]